MKTAITGRKVSKMGSLAVLKFQKKRSSKLNIVTGFVQFKEQREQKIKEKVSRVL
jgi:hypothetical protein